MGHLGRIVLVVLNQTDEKSLSAAELEKFVREQVNSSEIPQHCSVEKITVLEEALSPIRIYVWVVFVVSIWVKLLRAENAENLHVVIR